MKRLFFAIVSLFLLVFAGCEKEENVGMLNSPDTLVATIEVAGDTKAHFPNGTYEVMNVLWSSNDFISVFYKIGDQVENVKYRCNSGEGTTTGIFVKADNNTDVTGATLLAAVYPYTQGAAYNEATKTISGLAMASSYQFSSLKETSAPMASFVGDGNRVVFKNAAALVQVSSSNVPDGFSSVELSSATSKLSGSYTITFDNNGLPVAELTDDNTNTNAVTFTGASNQTVYFPILPGAYTDLTVTAKGDNVEPIVLVAPKALNAVRSNYYYTTVAVQSVSTQGELNNAITSAGTNDVNIAVDGNLNDVELPSTNSEKEVNLAFSSTSGDISVSQADAATVAGNVNIIATNESSSPRELNITLTNSTVQVSGSSTYSNINASTAENTLVLGSGVIAQKVTVIKGNIKVNTGATLSSIALGTDVTSVIIIDNGGTIADEVRNNTNVTVISADEGELRKVVAKGGEMKLVSNLALTSPLKIPADVEVVLDLNGNALSYTSATAGDAMITNNGSLTIKDSGTNGKITYSYTGTPDTSYGKGNYTIFNNGTLLLQSGIVENTTAAMSHASYAVNTGAGASFTMDGGKVLNVTGHAVRMVNFGSGANNMIVNDGYIEGIRAIQMQLPGSDASSAPDMNLKIAGGELKSNDETYNLAIYVYSNGQSGENVSIEITDGILDGNVALNGAVTGGMKSGAVKVSGGTIKGEYSVFSYSDSPDAGEKITVTGGVFHSFYSLYYMGSNEKMDVELQGDVTLEETLEIPEGVTLNLDLNGKTISQEKAQTGTYAMIANKGTLVIKDSDPNGNGKISYKDITEYSADNNYASNTIRNEGVLTLKSGTIENTSSDNVMNYGYPHAIDVYQGSTTNIEGGTVKSDNYDCIRMFCNSTTLATTVNISGGKIINRVTFQNPSSNQAGYGVLNITGGEFTTTEDVTANVRLLNFSTDVSNMKAKISGGTFDKGVKTQSYSSWTKDWSWLTIENGVQITKLD